VGCKLDPIIFDDVLQRLVATQRGQPSFPRYVLDVFPHHIFHSVYLKGSILKPQSPELPIYLPNQELLL